ncbi:JmjC domain, hydroxylase-domain-containing protein [Chiua virens]|nr:JmjC domain, hydroxylase-domain-containing protein [Chiua virens]
MSSSPSSLTPSRSGTPLNPVGPTTVQPDHFFGSEGAHLPPSPHSDGRPWLHPDDDPLAHRGIPVFKPTMDEFADFEDYMAKIECWGLKSGIVKVIPPKEWQDALPPIKDQLANVKIRSPIEQRMAGRGGLFRQENFEKRRVMSVREWAELCNKDEFRAPGIDEVGLHARSTRTGPRPPPRARAKASTLKLDSVEPEETAVKEEDHGESSTDMLVDESHGKYMSPPTSVGNPSTPTADVDQPSKSYLENGDGGAGAEDDGDHFADQTEDEPKPKAKRTQTRQREAQLAERAAKDAAFIQSFDPNKDWLPPGTMPDDYTTEFCQKLERQYWRNCGFGRPAWYGADTQGSLYTDETKIWNVGHLPSFLSRILPSSQGLPGVNLPYLYFGMWRATFAWHVEDMDLFSINYIHFGAPKFWYAVPQGRANALEATMKSYFPKDTSQCPQFLRHKSFLASPSLLAQSSCRPNFLVQREHEFVITYPRGYHAGFNLGFNCAESVNFALESWVELGRTAKACQCVLDSVRIDVDQLLRDREMERLEPPAQPPASSKRKAEGAEAAPKAKRPKAAAGSGPCNSALPSKISITLKLGPKPLEPEGFPCCLCVSMSRDGLLRVQDPPVGKKELPDSLSFVYDGTRWMAHEECAKVVPETWVDFVELAEILPDGSQARELRVFGVDAIVKDRWNLKCSACTKGRQKAHGAPIQCTKGKCTKSFHVSCAREGQNGVSYTVLREVEKEVILFDVQPISYGTPDSSASAVTHGGVIVQATQSTTNVEPRVLKTIKKNEVQLLCNQHNPAVAAAKKANKQDKIRNELLALPPMSRIKLRVSAGVFEVSLLRVVEETKSVEVLWDRGIKREFKWGSVVFGQTDGQTVMQKPSEPAPELAPQRSQDAIPTLHVATFPSSVSSSSRSSTSAPTPAPPPMYVPTYHCPTSMYATGSWPYQMSTPQQMPYSVAYTCPGFYPAMMPTTCRSPAESAGAQGTYRSQLQWQQPYIGPRTNNDPTGSSSQTHPMHS